MAQELRGWEGYLEIEETEFDIQSFEITYDMSTARADLMSGGPRKRTVPDKDSVTMNITAIRRADLNPHATPFDIGVAMAPGASGGYDGDRDYSIKMWETATESIDETKAWRCGTAHITRYSNRGQAENGLQIVSIGIEFSGAFAIPGEANLS